MEKPKQESSGTEMAERMWEESWTYIKTVVDTANDPFLILDKNLLVLAANKSFYKLFQVEAKDTEHKPLGELGNGEWNMPALQKLLAGIIPNNTFFTGFEVDREFPGIRRRVMLLNGRRIYKESKESGVSTMLPPIILLAMVDITQMTIIAADLADHVSQLQGQMNDRTEELEKQMTQLKKDVGDLKTNPQINPRKGNGKS